jgi:hypothetical protein
MSVLPILADVDWFYVAELYALIFFSAPDGGPHLFSLMCLLTQTPG